MKSYLKFLGHNKLYAAIEAFGLVVSLAFVVLIGTYVWQRYSILRENPDGDRIYVYGSKDWIALSYWDKASVDMEIPEVEASARLSFVENTTVVYGNDGYAVQYNEVDPEFFDIFPYYAPTEGSLEAFRNQGGVLISRGMANRISKDGESVVGMTVTFKSPGKEDKESVVSGIFEDMECTMMRDVDFLVNMHDDPQTGEASKMKFKFMGPCITFIRVARGTDTVGLEAKLDDLCQKNYDIQETRARLYTLRDLFFHQKQQYTRTTSKPMLYVLSVVVLLLLASAVFNYINLTFALSGKRAKEMATRRLLGSGRGDIFLKYIAESVAFTAVCFAFALLLAYALAPVLNRLLVGTNPDGFVPITISAAPLAIVAYVAGIALLGALSGMIPAAFSSRFAPIDIVRGTYRLRTKMTFSKMFIVLQSVLAVALIAIAVLMEVQLRYLSNRPMGVRIENIYYLKGGERCVSDFRPFVDRLAQVPSVKRVGFGSGIPGSVDMAVSIENDDFPFKGQLRTIICDSVYFSIMGFNVIREFGMPLNHSVWFGESADKAMGGLTDSSSTKRLDLNINGAKMDYVAGVIGDFQTQSVTEAEINPDAIVMVDKESDLYYCYPTIETVDQSKETERAIMDAWESFCMEKYGALQEPYEHGFFTDLNKKALSEATRTMRLMELFMGLAVLLSLMGLVAMSIYFSEQRSKDMAIRKVFGGTIESETSSGVSYYMRLSLASCVIGVPLAVWACGRYLQQFAYRVSGYWWVFMVAVAMSLVIALVSVFWQVNSVARRSPAVELKKE